MKRVFSNASDVIHLWAQQTQDEARCGNVFFEGAVIYSYGRHYPLGLIEENKKGEKCAIINAAGYSVTTSKQIGWARYAVNHYKTFSIDDTSLMQDLLRATPEQAAKHLSAAIERRVTRLTNTLAGDTVKRKAATLEKWRNEALADCDNYLKMIAWYCGKPTREANAALKRIAGGNVADIKVKAEKAARLAAKKRAELEAQRLKERQAIIALAIPAWLNGEDAIAVAGVNYSTGNAVYEAPQVYLRIEGEDVRTSKGASFPLSHGLKALPIIRAIVASGETWQRNGKTIHLGHYQIDSISEGVIIAGCHTIPVAEVERLAANLGV